jgi:transcriptional regulator with GAF, ATPase, and Fis domain
MSAGHTDHASRRAIELPTCVLVGLGGEFRGKETRVGKTPFRIGKAADNDLVIDDPTVSRLHCEIARDEKGYLVRDLGSTNGTLLGGAEVKEAYLSPGVVVAVGQVEFQVRTATERVEVLPSEAHEFGEVVGKSLGMREIFGLLERLAPTDATVLLTGETGTGKDAFARSIHAHSPRARAPFIVVDCGAVVGSLIESELFGHEKGAFTGADTARAGAFELAHGGTLFLDEIGELPVDLQPKLLRVLEQRAFRRVGGSKEIRVDIRVLAATKRNLEAEVARGKFREDLFFRLAVVPIEVPPLRERRDDIPLLVERLLVGIAQRSAATPGAASGTMTVSRDAMNGLQSHEWPGNVRELRNVLERAAYLARAHGSREIRSTGLPGTEAAPASKSFGADFRPGRSYRETRTEWEELFERRYITWLLERNDGNISAAAREAEMDRKYLHKLAKKHGLHPADKDTD